MTATPRPAPIVDLYGHGQVARALLPLLEQAGIAVRSIRDSQGVVRHEASVHGEPVAIDCTSPAYRGPRATHWEDHLVDLLQSGVPLVTCNKAPLARAWPRLAQAARRGGSTVLATATAGVGPQVLAALGRGAAAHRLVRLDAILSGTLSSVVRDVAAGLTLDEAAAAAQTAGVAEPDPTLDLDGTDAYAKGIILHNTCFQGHPPLDIASRQAPFRVDTDLIRRATDDGLVVEPVTIVEPGSVRVHLAVCSERDALAPPPGHAAVRATAQGGGTYRCSGPAAGPTVTAETMLADLTSADLGPRRGGINVGPPLTR